MPLAHRGPIHLFLTASLAIAIVAIAACGGGDDEDDSTPTAEPTVEESPEEEDEEAEADSVTVDESFWHAGWKVTLGEATLTSEAGGAGEVSIAAEFENLGTDQATFDSQLLLTSSGNDYPDETFGGHDLPQVPGERTGEGSFNFAVDEEFTLEDATLIIGNAMNQQATVPIGPDGDDLVSLEPQEITAAGDVSAGAVTVTVERAELRADLPDRHSQMEEGKLALTVYFSVTPAGGIQIGQGVFQSPNVALELPNGTTVAVISDGVSGVNELLQGREGTTISDLQVRFEVDEPADGTYAFVVRGAYGPAGADVEGELAFVVEPTPTPEP